MNVHLNENYQDNYTILKKISYGLFAVVYKVKIRDTWGLRALKIFSLENYKLEQKRSSKSDFYYDYELKK